jgi:hypothetical protein
MKLFLQNIVLVSLWCTNSIYAHSAASCTNLLKDNKTCVGFPRYYHFNALPTPLPSSDSTNTYYASRDREFQLQAGVNRICPEMTIEEYTVDYPMAKAYPGQTLTIQHPPRGHSSQPSSPVWIYMYPEPNMYPQNKQLDASNFKLVAEYPFDNCVGVKQELSWANCTGTMTIPQSLPNGVYSFWWRWDLNGIKYNDCFEVDVQSVNKTRIEKTKSSVSVY